ncbi:MAG: ABC transporter ATP-binding protein/permease [Firmicutes bacterium]|nr:ABC transporter ATP-binding protein/permease [Bacillota bacterium]
MRFRIRAPWWWKLMAPHRGRLAFGLFATVVCGASAAWVPYWSGRAVHRLEMGQYAASRRMLGVMLAFTALAALGRYLMRNILIGLSRQIEREQRESLFAHLLERPFAFFERQRVGDLMSRLGEDIGAVRMATGPGLMSFLQAFSVLPVTLALMLNGHPGLTLAVMAPFALLGLGFYLVGKASHRLQQKAQVVTAALNTYSHETISGERVVQAFGLEASRIEGFEALCRKQARLSIRQSALFSSYGPMALLMGGLAAMVLVAFGGRLVLGRELSLGDLTAFTGYLAALTWPVMSLGWATNLFQRARAGQERIDQVLESPEPLLPQEKTEPDAAPARLELRDAEHRFATGRGLGPLSLEIPSGGSLAVVGSIGSGKTVLLQMLAGLREPTSGELKVDGRPLDHGNLRRHWAGLGWVPQEAFLFSATLRENLALGRPDATEEELWNVAQVASLDDLIRRLSAGLDTFVGERGVTLSGGERQRAALARALLRKPRLLLLDDALSAVDAETESRILANLQRHLGQTTLVLATHRVFVAELCDRVLVLEEGLPVQYGPPADLAAQEGPFARLKRLQSLERELVGAEEP